MTVTYASTGVDINRADDIVHRIGRMVPGIGGFGARIPLDLSGIKRPVLIAGADGVGTKIKISVVTGRHADIGIDLVAMNVNDILCSGARPLFFLDYIATSRIRADIVESLISGMVQGCEEAGCRLVGGETAELPGFYADEDYDLAGFSVGIVDEDMILGSERVEKGDIVIGLASAGVHANGFSLVRSVIDNTSIYAFEDHALIESLLVPTRIYVKPVLDVLEQTSVHAIAHITGGGIPGNGIRILPDGLGMEINLSSWDVPDVFGKLQKLGGISSTEMMNTFNMGIGMVLVVPETSVETAIAVLEKSNIPCSILGHIISGSGISWTGEVKL